MAETPYRVPETPPAWVSGVVPLSLTETVNPPVGLLRPHLGAMKNADDLNDTLVDSIHSKIRQPSEDEFSGIGLPASPSMLRELCQQINLVVYGDRYAARSGRTTLLLNVVANMSEIANSSIRPAEPHQPGYRWSIIFLTSA